MEWAYGKNRTIFLYYHFKNIEIEESIASSNIPISGDITATTNYRIRYSLNIFDFKIKKKEKWRKHHRRQSNTYENVWRRRKKMVGIQCSSVIQTHESKKIITFDRKIFFSSVIVYLTCMELQQPFRINFISRK